MTEIHLFFYQSILQLFINFNMFLQREEPLIPLLYDQMVSFLTKLAGRFMPISTIKEANGNFYHLKYTECQLNDELIHTLFIHSYSVIYMYMPMSLFCWIYNKK